MPSRSQSVSDDLYFGISYFGVLGTHPGFKIGIHYPIATLNQKDQAEKLDQVIGSASAIFYFHRRNHIGLGFNLELGFRNKQVDGLNKEVHFGVGYLRKFIPNKVYDFDGNEPLRERRFLGSSHFLKTGSIGFGRTVKNEITANSWSIKPTFFHIKPFNQGSILNFAFDAGYQFR